MFNRRLNKVDAEEQLRQTHFKEKSDGSNTGLHAESQCSEEDLLVSWPSVNDKKECYIEDSDEDEVTEEEDLLVTWPSTQY